MFVEEPFWIIVGLYFFVKLLASLLSYVEADVLKSFYVVFTFA